MYLDVNWKDGTVTHIPLAPSHTVQVVADGKIQDSFSFDGVGSLTLNLDGAPAATDPNPPANEGAAEGETPLTPEEQAAADAAAEAARQDAANAEAAAAADQAVATTVEAVQNIAAAPDVTPADKQLQIQTALADIETELADRPDSQALLDAKAQLEALAGEITEP